MKKQIEEYRRVKNRFHMPSHNGINIDGGLYGVAPYDITELSFSDNLASPTSCIKEIEDNLARVYHARRAIMLTQGATAGIETALLVAREARGRLYLLGETHKSCMSFASVIGLDLMELESVEDAIAKANAGEWIYVTSPNYFGKTIDIRPILDARAKGSRVIVDEAHGAHFVFSSLLPESMSDKADFVVESLHKTLPVFTGGACLLVNSDEYIDMAVFMKCKIHSTSPSYLIMQSIEYAIDYMETHGEEAYKKMHDKILDFREHLDKRYEVVDTDDFSRLVIKVDDADAVNSYLESHDTYIEMNDERRLVLIVTPFNYERLDSVLEILNGYSGETKTPKSTLKCQDFHLKRAKRMGGRLRFVPLTKAVGLVSMSEIALYPPGVPVVRTGDILTGEVVRYIESNRSRIVGLIGDTIAVREVCEEN